MRITALSLRLICSASCAITFAASSSAMHAGMYILGLTAPETNGSSISLLSYMYTLLPFTAENALIYFEASSDPLTFTANRVCLRTRAQLTAANANMQITPASQIPDTAIIVPDKCFILSAGSSNILEAKFSFILYIADSCSFISTVIFPVRPTAGSPDVIPSIPTPDALLLTVSAACALSALTAEILPDDAAP